MRRAVSQPYAFFSDGLDITLGNFYSAIRIENFLKSQACCARVAELADALDLGSSGQPWGFESPLSHQVSEQFPPKPQEKGLSSGALAACRDGNPNRRVSRLQRKYCRI